MIRIRNGIGGAVALAASLLLAVTPALGQDHGGYHGGGHGGGGHVGGGHFAGHAFAAPHGHYAVPQHWSGMHPHWGGGPRVGGGGWVRPWGSHWVPHTWGGGYWRGGFWPHVYLGWDFPWFLGVLPVGYSTYWWGGVPYYYTQGVYYAWNPDYDSYVVTDPPPVTGGVEDGAAAPPPAGQPEEGAPGPGAAPGQGAMSLYVYPKNGQSEQQTANDRYQCHEWAVSQTGYDPTNAANSSQAATATPDSYKRAVTACLDARGYSVQ
ncbi:MAG TPA: hypothetical protein VHY36_00585 [Steroidobacteraceae bacterium]|nr:hypothetical protein [Steroidobacteraceae bacterium]